MNPHRYDESGNTPGKIEIIPHAPTRLHWDFRNQQMLKTIDEAYSDAQKVLNVKLKARVSLKNAN